jgi:hypothetical protein
MMRTPASLEMNRMRPWPRASMALSQWRDSRRLLKKLV